MSCALHGTTQTWCPSCSITQPAPSILASGTGRHDPRDGTIATLTATIAALESQLASESRAILRARCAALASALLVALADVDPKAMSTYEQQAQRRAARALLEDA